MTCRRDVCPRCQRVARICEDICSLCGYLLEDSLPQERRATAAGSIQESQDYTVHR